MIKDTWIIEALLSIPKPVRPRVFVVFVGGVGRRKLKRVVLPWQKRLFATEACSERPLSLWKAGNRPRLSPGLRLFHRLCSLSQKIMTKMIYTHYGF